MKRSTLLFVLAACSGHAPPPPSTSAQAVSPATAAASAAVKEPPAAQAIAATSATPSAASAIPSARAVPTAGPPPLDVIASLRKRPAAHAYARPQLEAIVDDDDARSYWEEKGPSWFDERVRIAKAGKPELVRAILTHHGAWGCYCPDYYFGTVTAINPGDRWVEPIFSVDAQPPELESTPRPDDPTTKYIPDTLMLVEGWFTGKARDVTYGPEKTRVHTFNVSRLRVPRAEDLMPRIVGTTLPAFTASAAK